ncbi:hypothetical protein HDF16_006391 [Granulicella aggregans]|uniref:Uncharacterized protein n=1 Tax=Granulicella aggregans TaxID=474949 RepID=A0A7W8E8U3_9BACT|nr:hypothetical protein [Granulicella aggregans]MBB5061655.1 hypothetical protein [Granulicella aggregans]
MEEPTISQRLGRGRIRSSRSRSLGTKITLNEEREIVIAAEREGKSASEWARDVLLREARSTRADALFTEIVATRMLLNLVLKPLATGTVMKPEEFTGVLSTVRTTKRQAATDVMEQYATAEQKER